MNTTQQMINAYNGQQRNGDTQRAVEAQALLNCAARLHQAQQPGTDYNLYADQVRHNQRLWTVFQVSLCEEDNPLPHDLKITLLNLSRFVDKVSLRALAEHRPALLTSLIDINRNIAAGLNAVPEQPATTAAAPPPAVTAPPTAGFSASI